MSENFANRSVRKIFYNISQEFNFTNERDKKFFFAGILFRKLEVHLRNSRKFLILKYLFF